MISKSNQYGGIKLPDGTQLQAVVDDIATNGVRITDDSTYIFIDVDLSVVTTGFRFFGLSGVAGIWPDINEIESSKSIGPRKFETPEITIAQASAFTFPHGLGVVPDIFQARVICKIAEEGYSVGEEVLINIAGNDPGTGGTTENNGIMILPDSTDIFGFFGNDPTPIRIFNKSTGNVFNCTNANWRLIIKAISL